MLTIVRGLPGSGKSTFARQEMFYKNAIHLEADMYFIDNGEYKFNPQLISQAHRWCQESARIFLNNDYNVVISNTFTQKWEIEPYLKMAEAVGVNVKIYRCMGNYGSVHGVPETSLEKMRNRFEDLENEELIEE